MAVKIRLARKGRKKLAFYHIVVADSRSPRDGRFIESLGLYDPNTNPATIELNFDGALEWLQKGAQPTDTCRAILSYKGVLIKKHLLEGVKKGAFDEAEADRRFNEWLVNKEKSVDAKRASLESSIDENKRKRIEAEKLISETRAEEIARKRAAEAAAEAAGEETEEAGSDAAEEVSEETVAEEKVEETPAEEPVAEETPAEEPVAEETPAEEPVAEETPAKDDKPSEEVSAKSEPEAEGEEKPKE